MVPSTFVLTVRTGLRWHRAGRARQVKDEVGLKGAGLDQVVQHEVERGMALKQVLDVRARARREVVEAGHLVAPLKQAVAEMAAEEARAAGYQNTRHQSTSPPSVSLSISSTLPTPAAVEPTMRE